MRKKIVLSAFAVLFLILPTLTQKVSTEESLEYPTIVYPTIESTGIQLNATAYRLHSGDTLNLTFSFTTHEFVNFTLLGYYNHYHETEEAALVNKTFYRDGVYVGHTYMRYGMGGSGSGTGWTKLGPGVLLPGAHMIEWKWLFTVDEDAEGYFDIDLYDVKLVLEKVASATIDIHPDTLNLKSKGKWITCYIELPEGYDASDIDVSTVMLNKTVPVSLLDVPAPKPVPTEIGDYDGDGIPDLMVKFDRTMVSELILSKGITYGDVTLTITGEVDGTFFADIDSIKVVSHECMHTSTGCRAHQR
jgi:hypothetical protein